MGPDKFMVGLMRIPLVLGCTRIEPRSGLFTLVIVLLCSNLDLSRV